MQTGKANYRLAARLRGNELLLDADLRKAVEEEHLRAVRRAEGLKCCADRRAFAESVEWERLGDFFLRIGSHPSAVRAYRDAALACLFCGWPKRRRPAARATHGCAPCWRMIRCSGKDTLC